MDKIDDPKVNDLNIKSNDEEKKKPKKEEKTRVIPVRPIKVDFEFTCPRCGSHLYTEHVASVAKFSGSGIGFSKIVICRVCGFSKEYKF